MERVIAAAKKTKTVMEINSFPERSDLKDEYIRACVEAGVKLSIDSDAHSAQHFPLLENGIAQARRGWAEKKDVINTGSVEKMFAALKR
jgi:DNA polymerase (family 10)